MADETLDPAVAESFGIQPAADEGLDPAVVESFQAPKPGPEDQQADDARLGLVLRNSLGADADQQADVAALSRATGLSHEVVAASHKEIREAYDRAKQDPVEFRRANPQLAEFLLRHPKLAPAVMQDEGMQKLPLDLQPGQQVVKPLPKSSAAKVVEAVGDWKEQLPFDSELANNAFRLFKFFDPGKLLTAGNESPLQILVKLGFQGLPKARPDKLGTMEVAPEVAESGLARLGMYARQFKKTWKSQENSAHGLQWMMGTLAGDAERVAEAERKKAAVDQEVGLPLYFDAGPVEQFGLDAAEAMASQGATLLAGSGGAAVGAGMGMIPGLIKRDPALMRAGAKKGAEWGQQAAGTAVSFGLEAGSAAWDFKDIKTEAGEQVDPVAATAAAMVYGLLSAGVENEATQVTLKSFGPLGQLVARGERKEFGKALLRHQGIRQFLTEAGKSWMKAMPAEGGEEAVQTMLQTMVGGTLRQLTAGWDWQSVDIAGALGEATEAGMKGVAGGFAGGGVSVPVSVAGQVLQAQRQGTAEQQVEAIVAGVAAANTTSKTDPVAVQELVLMQTAKTGVPVKALYVSTDRLSELLQQGSLDPDATMTTLLGPEGPQRFKAAVSTGEKLEISVAEFAERWADKPIAQQLKADITTAHDLRTQRERILDDVADAEEQAKLVELFKAGKNDVEPGPAEKRFMAFAEEQLLATQAVESTNKDGKTSSRKASMQQVLDQVSMVRAAIATMAKRSNSDRDALFDYFQWQIREGKEMPWLNARDTQAVPGQVPVLERAWRELATQQRDGQTVDVQADAFYSDPTSGLLNERAVRDLPVDPAAPFAAPVTFGYKKPTNDVAGHERLNDLYRDVGRVLDGLAPGRVAKVGGDFWILGLKNQEELDTLFEAARAQLKAELPEGFDLPTMGALFERGKTDSWQAEKYAGGDILGDLVDAERKAKRYPDRTQEPFGGDKERLKATVFKGERAPRRELPAALREQFAKFTEYERATQMYYDPSGALSKAGWDEVRRRAPKAFVASLDLRAVASMDKTLGHFLTDDVVDIALRMFVDAGGAKFDVAHVSGDEVMLQADDINELKAFLASMESTLGKLELEWADAEVEGGVFVQEGVFFSAGIAGGPDAEHVADAIKLPEAKNADPHRTDGDPTGKEWYAARTRRLSPEAAKQRSAARDARGAGAVREGATPTQRRRIPRASLQGLAGAPLAQLSPEAQALAERIVSALEEADRGPSPDAEVALPADPVLFQVERDAAGNLMLDAQGSAFGRWKEHTREWMEENEYTAEEIADHLKAIDGQLAIFSALGPAQLEYLPRGARELGMSKEKGPIRKNVDPIYRVSFDASAMCVKRLEAAATQAYIQGRLGRSLTSSERLALVALFRAAGKQAPCLYCYVESPRAKASEFAAKALAVVTSGVVPEGYKKQAREKAEKAIAQYRELGLAPEDINPSIHVDPVATVSREGLAAIARAPAVYDFVAQQVNYAKANRPKLYEEYQGQVLDLKQELIDKLNSYAGFRIFSTSDFQAEHLADLQQLMFDLDARKAKAHAYTKVKAFAEVFGATGTKIQTSLFADPGARVVKQGDQWLVVEAKMDKLGRKVLHGPTTEDDARAFLNDYTPEGGFAEDAQQGMAWNDAREVQRHPDVGAVFVATSDAQVRWALDQPWIQYIIPFHFSGMEKRYYAKMGWSDFTSTQTEKRVKGLVRQRADGRHEVVFYGKVIGDYASKTAANDARRKHAREVWEKAIAKRTAAGEKTPDPAIELDEETEQYTVSIDGEVLTHKKTGEPKLFATEEKAREAGEKARGVAVQKIRMHELTDNGKAHTDEQMKARYLTLAEERGIEPVFSQFSEHPNYAKLKKDYARSDTDFTQVHARKIDQQAAGRVLDALFERPAPAAPDKLDAAQRKGVATAGVDKPIGDQMLQLIDQGHEDVGLKVMELVERGQVGKTGKLKAAAGSADKPLFQSEGQTAPGDLGQALYSTGSDVRGWMYRTREGGKRQFNIFLAQGQDMSTFLHESGHAFLMMMQELAQLPDAPQGIRDDFQRALSWLGVTDQQTELTVDQHEQWARGFEAYLMEGKSPSPELTGAFKRFRGWLLAVYKAVRASIKDVVKKETTAEVQKRALRVELNDEIRGVFDRMLATDEEIAVAKGKAGLMPLFRSPEDAGVEGADWVRYLEAQERALEHARTAAQLGEYRARLIELRKQLGGMERAFAKQAQDDYDALRESVAVEVLRTGKVPGIDPKVGKLRWGEVSDIIGTDATRQLEERHGSVERGSNRRSNVLWRAEENDDGPSPGDIADLLGYPDAISMLQAVANHQRREDWVEARRAQLVEGAGASLLTEGAELQARIEASLQRDTPQWLLHELAMLGKKVGGKPPATASIKAAAAQIAGEMRVGAISARRMLVAERANADKALKAAAKGDYAQALVYKQQQLLSAYAYQELKDAEQDRDELVVLALKLSQDDARAKLGRAALAYQDVVDALLTATGLADPVPPKGRQLYGLPEATALLRAVGVSVLFDESVVGRVLAEPGDWRRLTVSDAREVIGALRTLRKAASTTLTALVDGKRVDRAKVIAELVQEAKTNRPRREAVASSEPAMGFGERVVSLASKLDGDLLRPETMIEWLGGDVVESMWGKAILQPLQRAKQKEGDLLHEVAKPLLAAFENIPERVRGRMMENVDGEALFPGHREGIKPPSKRFELLVLALNMGNDSNRHRLFEGRKITEAQCLAALELLTVEELQWVQGVWDAVESLWPMARDLEERVTGLAPKKIEPRAFTVKGVQLRGGYYPAIYDRRDGSTNVGEMQETAALSALLDRGFTRPGTPHAHLKGRAEVFADVVSLDPGGLMRHVQQAVHDIAYREAVLSVGSLLMAKDVQLTLKRHLGDERSGQFLSWLQAVGNSQGLDNSAVAKGFTGVLRRLKNNMATATMGYRLDIALGDLASNVPMALATGTVKARHLAAALADFGVRPFKARDWALSKSGELRARHDDVVKKLRSEITRMTARNAVTRSALYRWWNDHAFTFMEWSDAATVTPVWMGAYRQGLAEASEKGLAGGRAEAFAVASADAAVRKVFPPGHAVDKSAALRDTGMLGAQLMFHGYFNTMYQRFRDLAHDVQQAEGVLGTLKAGGLAVTKMLAMGVAMGVLGELASGRGREEDEEWAEWFARKTLVSPLLALPFLGQFVEAVLLKKQTSIRAGPTMAALDQIGRTIWKATNEEKEVSEEELTLEVLKSAAMLFGKPLPSTLRAVGSLEKTADDGPARVLSGIVYGDRGERQPENLLTLANGD